MSCPPLRILPELAEVDLGGLAERSYAHLSGGEQRRVHIARALAQVTGRPGAAGDRYLLLDEPLSNLDLRHRGPR